MRRYFVALAFCLCAFAVHGQKQRLGQGLPNVKPGDNYPIKIHISGVHYRTEYSGSGQNDVVVYADAVMHGEIVELRGERSIPFRPYKVPLGDSQARLLKDSHEIDGTILFQEYEIALPNGTAWKCIVTGISEK
jgi:hypothetical protein